MSDECKFCNFCNEPTKAPLAVFRELDDVSPKLPGSPAAPGQRMVDAGRLCRKTGSGFYAYA
ncbi:hypothetical protein [Streptomyces halstedii]|uniref:hypothetical protein n=1 Tax=Streptomyces halstedii TaxID=1944 RepID=UPI0036D168C3